MNKKVKQIKDLTKEELDKICKKHFYCSECPLEIKVDGIEQGAYSICIKHAIELMQLKDYKRRIEIEIEVEENDSN